MLKNLLQFIVMLSLFIGLLGCGASRPDSSPTPERNVGMVIREIRYSSQGPNRAKLVKYLDAHYPTDEKVINFYLDVIRHRDWLMLGSLSEASHVRSPRLIEPLMESIRLDRGRSHASHFVLVMLRHQRSVMAERGQIMAELGQIVLGYSRWFGPKPAAPPQREWFSWRQELDDLALTGDPALVPVMAPWLDRRDVIQDARLFAIRNNGVSTRACDATWNALSVLLDLPGEPLSPLAPLAVTSVEDEYARRDALIEQLKRQL